MKGPCQFISRNIIDERLKENDLIKHKARKLINAGYAKIKQHENSRRILIVLGIVMRIIKGFSN